MNVLSGEISIPPYGLMILAGLAAGAAAGVYLIRKKGLSADDFTLLAVYTVSGGFLGAKLLYLWVSRGIIDWGRMTEMDYLRKVMSGGFVFYGGLFGGLVGLFAGARIHHIDFRPYLYTAIPALPLVHGFGRIGCGLAGCCYGIPYSGPFHICYTNGAAALHTPLFPVQYLEAVINFLLAAHLFFRCRNKKADRQNVEIYLLCYSTARFFLEFLRYDRAERGYLGYFSTSQWISLGIFVFTAVFCILHSQKKILLK